MSAGNTVTLEGNLTREAELNYIPSGRAVAKFGLAVNRKWQNRTTQEWEEQVSFFNVVAWAQLGENVAGSLTKGDRVIVTGRLEQRSWEADDGTKRSTVEVVADSIGPSLRYATAAVTRNERSDSTYSGGGNAVPNADPGLAAPANDLTEEPF